MKLSPIIIFFLSLLASLLVLVIERLVGIDMYFHPDALTYLQTSGMIVRLIEINGFMNALNNGYYIMVWALNYNPTLLISINIFLFCLTNMILYAAYEKLSAVPGLFRSNSTFLFLLVILNPYRLHISSHILKDTVIIFFYIAAVCSIVAGGRFAYAKYIAPLLVFRLVSALYFVVFLNRKLLYATIVIGLIIAVIFGDLLTERLLELNDTELSFREFDNVPTFKNLGIIGVVIRALVWPLFVLSGAYLVISPAVLYIPLAVGVALLQIWSFVSFRRPAITLEAYTVLGLLSVLAPGFVSYNRYCLPVVVAMPILVMIREYISLKQKQEKLLYA